MAGGRLWELWELELLATMRPGEIADLMRRLGRTESAIRGKRRKLGLTKPRALWTDAERAELHRRVAAGESVQSVAASLGRSRRGAYVRRVRCRQRDVEVPDAPQPPGRGYRGGRQARVGA